MSRTLTHYLILTLTHLVPYDQTLCHLRRKSCCLHCMTNFETMVGRKLDEALSQLEQKLNVKLDSILNKMDQIESRIDGIQTEQIRLGVEIDKIKEVVVDQQRLIERHETDKRRNHLIISGVPEANITIDNETLKTDMMKVQHFCDEVCDTGVHIYRCIRLGKDGGRSPRIIKAEFAEVEMRNKILRSQKALRSDPSIINAFGRIYFNPDSTPLGRKEDNRLRETMRNLKSNSTDKDLIFMKKGMLYKNGEIVDKFDIRNQIF